MAWYPSNESETGMIYVEDEDYEMQENMRIMTSPDYVERVMNATDEEIYQSEES